MEDDEILAGLDGDPDAFAVFYRRHAVRLLDDLTRRTGDPRLAAAVCAETFAAALEGAHRFDPQHGSAAGWLDGISSRLVARTERRGSVDERARRRLGMAPLELGGEAGPDRWPEPGDVGTSPDRERFVRELEEELVAAARFRAEHPRRGLPRPRVPARAARGALAGIAALALVAAVAALALNRGDAADERAAAPSPQAADDGDAADERAAAPSPQAADDFSPLVPMLAAVDCGGKGVREEPASPVMPDIGVLQRGQHADDALPGDVLGRLPVETLDRTEPRLARNPRMTTRLHVVPSLAVSEDGRCDSNSGPGVCLVVERGSSFRCFALDDVRAGRAVARTPDGLIVGLVPDGIARVTVTAPAIVMAPVVVVDNVYEADFGVLAGTPVRIELPAPVPGCAPRVSKGLLDRVAALRRAPPEGRRLPQAAIDHLRGLDGRIGAIVEDGARFWGTESGVEFWVLPVVPSGGPDCAPANRACVVAVAEGARADSYCDDRWNPEGWRLAPLLPGNAVVFGIVPSRVTRARVTIGDQSATVDASENVMAGVLPFPYDDYADTSVDQIHARDPFKPSVGVVDAAGRQGRYHAEYLLRELGEAGYPTVEAITPGVKAQPETALYWWPGRVPDLEIGRLAELLRVDRVVRIDEPDRAPLPVVRNGAPIVIVAGHGLPSPG